MSVIGHWQERLGEGTIVKVCRWTTSIVLALVALTILTPTPGVAKAKAKESTTKPRSTIGAKTSTTTTNNNTALRATTSAAPVTTTTSPSLTGSINVSAAASLTASFTDIASAFEKANLKASVTLNFAGSSTLVTQIQNGAPADVFASADIANMDKLRAVKLVIGTPATFARNRPMIVVRRGNPLQVETLADLGKPEVFVALGAPGVPVGDYARQILAKAGIEVKPKTLEPSVSAIVNKVALREIDAGIVYVTDVAIDEYRVDGVAIPDDQNVIATYPIAALSNTKNNVTAAGFVSFVQSPAAQAILAKYKFLPPK